MKSIYSFFWKVFDFTEIPFEWESYTNFIISLVEISWNQYPFDQLVKKVDQITVMLWHHTVWKFRKFFRTAKIFRQIDLQYNSLVKKLIWRKFCKISWWGKKLANFHTINIFKKFMKIKSQKIPSNLHVTPLFRIRMFGYFHEKIEILDKCIISWTVLFPNISNQIQEK